MGRMRTGPALVTIRSGVFTAPPVVTWENGEVGDPERKGYLGPWVSDEESAKSFAGIAAMTGCPQCGTEVEDRTAPLDCWPEMGDVPAKWCPKCHCLHWPTLSDDALETMDVLDALAAVPPLRR